MPDISADLIPVGTHPPLADRLKRKSEGEPEQDLEPKPDPVDVKPDPKLIGLAFINAEQNEDEHENEHKNKHGDERVLGDVKPDIKPTLIGHAFVNAANPKGRAQGSSSSRPRKTHAKDTKSTAATASRGVRAPKKWTPTDLEALFVAATGGASVRAFEGKVAGRTGKQCYDTWNNTVVPFLLKALRERGEGKR